MATSGFSNVRSKVVTSAKSAVSSNRRRCTVKAGEIGLARQNPEIKRRLLLKVRAGFGYPQLWVCLPDPRSL